MRRSRLEKSLGLVEDPKSEAERVRAHNERVLQSVSVSSIDRIFAQSPFLNSTAIVDFVRCLCTVSRVELGVPNDTVLVSNTLAEEALGLEKVPFRKSSKVHDVDGSSSEADSGGRQRAPSKNTPPRFYALNRLVETGLTRYTYCFGRLTFSRNGLEF